MPIGERALLPIGVELGHALGRVGMGADCGRWVRKRFAPPQKKASVDRANDARRSGVSANA